MTQVKLDLSFRLLFAGDSLGMSCSFLIIRSLISCLVLGFVFIYEVGEYGLKHETDPPPCEFCRLTFDNVFFELI